MVENTHPIVTMYRSQAQNNKGEVILQSPEHTVRNDKEMIEAFLAAMVVARQRSDAVYFKFEIAFPAQK